MKRIIVFLLVVVLGSSAFAQTLTDIKNSNDYLWGEGTGNSVRAATKNALDDLISKISVNISSEFTQVQTETNEEYEERVNSIVKTYSNVKLNNTNTFIVSEEPNAKVVGYISKAELKKQFADRRNRIVQLANDAVEYEKANKISDALRSYYWSLTLLNSYPKSDTVTFSNGESMLSFLYKRINDVFGGLKADIVKVTKEVNKQTVELAITYKGNPVANYDYTYNDGKGYSNIIGAKNGKGVIELSDLHELKNIKLKSEYIFEDEAVYDADLTAAFKNMTDITSFHSNNILVGDDREKAQKILAQEAKQIKAQEKAVFEIVEDHNPYLDVITAIEQSIKKKDYDSVEKYFTPNGFQIFNRLISYGNAKLLSNEIGYSFYKIDKGVICRSMPICFRFTGNKEFVESIVFEFNEDKKIESLSFQLEQEAVADITSKNKWAKESRHVIIRFLENYKTAYALERLDYLKQIFSDKALIITGSTVAKAVNLEKTVKLNEAKVKFNEQSKEQYMANLERCFKNNTYINLRFTDNDIKKQVKDKEIYGIQIKQDYFSSTYGDTGYLFLGVDVEDPDKPIIHVRTWQPAEDTEGGIFGIEDFSVE